MPQSRDDTELKILVIDENPLRRAIIEEGLREAGQHEIKLVSDMNGLVEKIYSFDPDVLLIDLENPSRDVLEQMFQVSRLVRRPIAMFVDKSDGPTIDAAIDAGVSAYIVDGLRKERVRPILETTISRFRAFDRLRSELEETRSALKERKIIEKAKGILMKTRGLEEEAAYAALRRQAMSTGNRIADVAAALISTYNLLNDK
ncbi:Two-component response regulator [Candidatus Filomicrobium marinum]|uniref:Two-component response regulator n=1 Tax=Candidatus Filomicrobium marinum TaxID=1608628 RepID=A0A0D6JDU8_9HYPH|nr:MULTISPECIES: ANTAR domain-containing protein [Filomicrobium]MCV0368065.1 ANTAR domain-containing protein [Filomicrobium sp.]CFX15287.1 Two-component response regulator [Candidatus Filomicrobium marinum]CPR17930.1 Two-component response regulator [Candidatus Filomicrobium marinum]